MRLRALLPTALVVLSLILPGAAKATAIINVTEWDWESDEVACVFDTDPGCTWTNTLNISANVSTDTYQVFAQVTLRGPVGQEINEFVIPLSLDGPDLTTYFDFSGFEIFSIFDLKEFQEGPWTGFGQVCLGNLADAYCVTSSTPQSDTFNVIPEPATLALFTIGLAGLGFMTRRRKKFA